jgi:dihydropteroate synthase
LSGDPAALATAARLCMPVILMHMQGQPQTMQADPRYEDVVAEVCAYLIERARLAMAAGVAREAISLDPGIGFGKTLNHNLALLSHLDGLKALGFPVVLGVSRKRFIQGLDPSAKSAEDRLGGSIAAALAGARAGVDVLRVHDVGQTAQALAVWQAIEEGRA